MHRLQIGGIDRRQSPGQRRADFAVVNQRCHRIQNLALLIHVGRAVDRPREHQLVVDRHRLALENHDIECLGIVDQSEPSLWGDQFGDVGDMLLGMCGRKDESGSTDAEFGDLWRERTRMVDDVVSSKPSYPLLGFRSRGCGDDGEVRALSRDLDGDRPNPARATDDEDRLRRTGYGLRHVQAVEHRLPGSQRRQRQRRRFRPGERRRFVTDNPGVDEMELRIGTGSVIDPA